MSDPIYLDYNATTPVAPEVIVAMQPYLEQGFGNPSSLHWAGRPARDAVERARGQVARLLGCVDAEIVFTSGGSEANNFAIQGTFFARSKGNPRPHIVTTQVEHPAIHQPCAFLERLGAEVTRLPVDRMGLVDPEAVRRALRPETILVTVMHANNEVGTIQPIAEIAAIVRPHAALFHTDAAQSMGKIPVNVATLDVDLLSIAGHKLYGPKGVGVLYVRSGIRLEPLIHGAGHESGRRASTENVLGVVGLGAACELAAGSSSQQRLASLRDAFWDQLEASFGARVVQNGALDRRLPNTLSVGFRGANGAEILARLPSVAASTGSACHAGAEHISPVLRAMNVSPDIALGTIRFSLGRSTTLEQIESVVEQLQSIGL